MKHLKYILSVLFFVVGITTTVYSQKGIIKADISGKVYESATGKPVSGAIVSIPGVVSSITSDSGTFKLDKSIRGAILLVQAPGFASKRVPVLKRQNITIYLLDGTFKGKQENVAMPFGMVNAGTTSSAISSHENRDDYKLGVSTLGTVLQGNITGLNTLARTGAPGAGSNLFLNGFSSLNSNSQPLIVVDGVMYENTPVYSLVGGNTNTPLADLDIKDIGNITVLKDGGAIYGSKASNGVVLINTLEAKEEATRINFYAYTGTNFEPNTKYKMMDGNNYKTYLADMMSSQGLTVNQIQSLPYINTDKPVTEKWGVAGNADYYRYNQSTNWQDEVFNKSMNQNYYLNVTGGSNETLYAVSFGYLGQGGLVDNTSYSRYSTRVNAKIKMTNWFRLNTNMSFVYSEKNLAYEGLNRNFNPVYAGLIKAPFEAADIYNVLGQKTPNLETADIFNVSNPKAILNSSTVNSNHFRFFGNMNGIVTFSKNLNASVLVGITTDNDGEHIFLPQLGIYHSPLASAAVTNEAQQLRNILFQINTDSRLNYHCTFNYINDLSFHLGSRFQSSKNELDWGKAYNSANDQMRTVGDGKNSLSQTGGSLGNWNSLSNYVNLDYGLLSRYFISLNGALDGSSRFGVDASGVKIFNNTFGVFPSASAAWVISSENFMKHQHLFDLLKLRGGYSVTGNDDLGNYSAQYYYTSQSLLGSYGLVRANIPNTKLTWETNRKEFAGFDASFLKERLNMSVDLFISKTSDLVSLKNITTASGIGVAIYNDGELQNKGIDVNLNARMINLSRFKWDLGLNVSTYKNLLLSKSTDQSFTTIDGGIIRTKVGSPIGQFYGYQTNGVYSSQAEASAAGLKIQNPDGTVLPFTAGDVKFVDQNNDHIIDSRDMKVIGDPNPDFIGSFTNNFQLGRFTLNALITFSVGNDVYNAFRANLESMTNTDNQTISAIYRWKVDGQVTNTPKAVWGDPMGNSRFSSRWIEDGSFARLKSITLAYDLPLKSGFITNAQIYVTGSNLLTFTKYLGYEPEFSTGTSPLYYGVDNGVTPQPRSVLFGIKVGL